LPSAAPNRAKKSSQTGSIRNSRFKCFICHLQLSNLILKLAASCTVDCFKFYENDNLNSLREGFLKGLTALTEKRENVIIEKLFSRESSANPESIIKHPLENSWTLWYFKNDRNRQWEENQREVIT
jgi:hypothetical protein